MDEFWNYNFTDTPEFIDIFDELPLWSAPFGLMLLKNVGLKPNMQVLDLGSGAGFPLLELAERLGKTCKCYGLDPWLNANARARKKISGYNVSNVEVIEGSAENIPFETGSIDLIVSNLGVNNFKNPETVFRECHRVLRKGGVIALTTNLNGHWKEFYEVFGMILKIFSMNDSLQLLNENQVHRGTVESIAASFHSCGFETTKIVKDEFKMRFLDGSSFLNHHFIKLGWLGDWKSIIPENKWKDVFTQLETNLNELAEKNNELSLTVPMAYIEFQKK